jgi:hypothetical protein
MRRQAMATATNTMQQGYYIIRWKGPHDKDWHISWSHDSKMNITAARKRLADDIGYFYDDIEIQLVRVAEKVVSVRKGSNPKAQPAKPGN